jgi:hypothetical protein
MQATVQRGRGRLMRDKSKSRPDRPDESGQQDPESGEPGGGKGRRDEVGPTGVYPMSGGIPPGHHLEVRTPAAWGQGERGAEGYNDAGGSELVMRDGQLLGGLTAGPGGEPTIDIHGGDRPPEPAPDHPTEKRDEQESADDRKRKGRRGGGTGGAR